MSDLIALSQLPSLAELFRFFLAGKHLNRLTEPVLWVELEKQEIAYTQLFAALGYVLRVDIRGFAWFHSGETSSAISKTSRQLALLLMVIFDTQANAGKPLFRFTDWLIDREQLALAHSKHEDVLNAEGIAIDDLADLMGKACTLGFACVEPNGWRLLPAVFRYLDHFETLSDTPSDEESEFDLPADTELNDDTEVDD
jgi:hypothetical protein